jgi:hypothetical protein
LDSLLPWDNLAVYLALALVKLVLLALLDFAIWANENPDWWRHLIFVHSFVLIELILAFLDLL